jgi:A/G-specific adenine glycosylase
MARKKASARSPQESEETTPSLAPARLAALRPRLLAWYRRNSRALPWRRDRDPYRVWLSEVMLQQTTVASVLPYYERFLERFPDLRSLASAGEDEVLALWSGLGYYHRARNLLRAARHVVEHHGGRFPRSLDAALGIPGVGLYTASAVLSIAHGLPLPVVDGNVRRVLARLLALRGPRWRKDGPYYNLAEELLDRKAPGDWNQALMELGATVCTPRKPGCDACPLRAECAACRSSLQDELPEGRARRAPVAVTVAVALIETRGRFLLVKRPEGRLLGRMWELPQTSLESRGRRDLKRELRERHGLDAEPGRLVAEARHAITYRRIRVEGYRTRLAGALPSDPDRFLWASEEEILALPVSSMTRKLLGALGSPQMALELEGGA